MDTKTAEIRYQRWVQVIQDWNNSGLSKRDYCQQNAIDEKQFYYYQRRIRAIIVQMAAFSGQQGRNSRPVRAIIGGQQAA